MTGKCLTSARRAASEGTGRQPPQRGSKGPLPLLSDSTGIEGEGEGAWHAGKHDGPKRQTRRKIQLGLDGQTLAVRDVESERVNATGPIEPANGSQIGDVQIFPDLLDRSSRSSRSPAS